MKPPRVFIKQGAFWISCYVPDHPNDWRKPTGIKVDQKFLDQLAADPNAFRKKPNWWKTSKYAPGIKEAIDAISFERDLYISGLSPSRADSGQHTVTRYSGPELNDLVNELNEEGSAEEQLSNQTIRRRKTSAATILRYDQTFVPNIKVDKKWVSKFRSWMTALNFTDWTQYTVLQDLKLFFKFAASKRYIDHNPIGDLTFTQPESNVEHTTMVDEQKMFSHLYHRDVRRFVYFMMQRFTGYRYSDVIKFKRSQLDLKNKLIVARNIKGKRPELFPISDALDLVLNSCIDILGPDSLFVDTYAAALKALKVSAHATEVKYATHQCKRNYLNEVEDTDPLQHIFDMLAHHKTKSVAGRHYTGKNIELMRKHLNLAHEQWLPFLRKLLGKTGTKQGLGSKKA